MESPEKYSTPLARRSTEGWGERPFGRLVRHFLARLARSGRESASDESDLGAGGLLGVLAAPGAFASLLMLDKYSSLLNWIRGWRQTDMYVASIPDKYLFLTLAMALTGIVTVLKWDQILPDAQDYLNLAPLPVPPRSIFLANAVAIAFAAAVVALDVSAVPALLFPFFVTASKHAGLGVALSFVGVHCLSVLLASASTFLATFAVMGSLAALLPRAAFRACSSWLRGALLLGFLALLASAFAGETLVARLEAAPHTALRWLPSLWYLGLYQRLQNHAGTALSALAPVGVAAAFVALAAMALAYGLSYRRHLAGVPESLRRPAQQRIFALGLPVLDLFGWRSAGFERACHRFAVRALLRSEAHRLVIAVSIGLGWLLALQTIAGSMALPLRRIPDLGSLEAPLGAAYLVILGLRVAFELPAGAAAGWVFRVILDPRENQTVPAARRVMIGFLIPVVAAPALAYFWWRWGTAVALVQTLYLLALAMCLMEILLLGYRKIPLMCPAPGFRNHFPLLCLMQVVGFEVFSGLGAAMEHWMFLAPARFLPVPAVMGSAWLSNRRRIEEAREAGEWEEGLTFETAVPRVIERLDLS